MAGSIAGRASGGRVPRVSAAGIDGLLRPHFAALLDAAGRPRLFDAHTHIGENDPDGMRQSAGELLAGLPAPDARAVVFPMHEPDGYRAANDAVLGAAGQSGGRLVAFCRVNPRDGAVAEARRCLDAGARGIKLHPRAEGFTLAEPAVAHLVALAAERRACVLIHAGRGIPALGRDTLALSARFPGARLILAHSAISDLAWLWRELPGHPNLFVDTSWWHPGDLLALFSLVAPRHVLWASDSPYAVPSFSAILALRCALQAGLRADQLDGVMGRQLERLLDGDDPVDLGSPPGPGGALDPLLERVVAHLTGALHRAFAHADVEEPLALARLACAIGEDHPHAQLASEVLELLDGYQAFAEPPGPGRVFPDALRLLVTGLVLARTPAVALPARPAAPPPTREAAE
jgi:hypothetical protein